MKKYIGTETRQALATVDADALTLYQMDVDGPEELEEEYID